MKRILMLLVVCQLVLMAKANDGSSLWLPRERNTQVAAKVRGPKGTALDELKHYYKGQVPVRLKMNKKYVTGDAYRITVTPQQIELTAATSNGLLYAVYDLLRMQQLGDVRSKEEHPAFDLRLINHWDNLDGSVERGYAGKSILYPTLSDRIDDYARANASIGINGIVINNVNASPKMLSREWLEKVKVISTHLEHYGIRTYLSINFATPMALDGLPTADPLDPQVQQWWRQKVGEIYRLMPHFGGFLVKANSEGQPGPGDYHRTHADGANMLADALAPHGGIVMWRCFVYGANHKGEDRVKQAVSEFKPLDGQFRENVILQTKNGPLDFQPREPYSPVFDQITQTPNMAELQITQEYLGQSRHLVYLAPMWKEFFSFVSPGQLRGIAGVANVGTDANWSGHHFSQANWYAFGRLAWNPELSAEDIAREWLQLTFTRDAAFVRPMTEVMLASREACVDYMMPLGLHHIFQFDHHYGPDPGGFKPEYPLEWCPVYYHQADSLGVGFNRSSTGTNATSQYREPYRSLYDDPVRCPENLLLWFHHVPWNHQMKSGRTLWQELCAHYDRGVAEVDRFHTVWQQMRPLVLRADQNDPRRWQEVEERLRHQQENAREWRQVCLDYFQQFSGEK
ncbi:MAG: alpha-glucuronidase [Bacteroidaceae bacterium]|nr:alpha-glucuronidase [Bacteroidaceae bacterium]